MSLAELLEQMASLLPPSHPLVKTARNTAHELRIDSLVREYQEQHVSHRNPRWLVEEAIRRFCTQENEE